MLCFSETIPYSMCSVPTYGNPNDIAFFIAVFIAFDALSVNLIKSTSIHCVFDFNFSLIIFALNMSLSPGDSSLPEIFCRDAG